MPRVAVSQGRPRPEVRVERLPKQSGTARRATRASRRRAAALTHRGGELLALDLDDVAEWLQPFVGGGREHLTDLLAELPDDLAVNALALVEELAATRMVARGLIRLGATGDQAALREARQWLTQARLHAVALAALIGEHVADSDDDPLAWIDATPQPAESGSKHVDPDHPGVGNPPVDVTDTDEG